MLYFLLSYKEHEFTESVSTAVASVPIYKVMIKNTISKDIEIKVLLDLDVKVPIILSYFIKKYNLTIIERK
jgi:hypothetical protein